MDSVAVAGRTDPEHDLEVADLGRAIERALEGLAPEVRTTFVLREVEGRSYAEIATLVGTSEPALRKRVERAKAAVRAALEEWQ